MKHKSFITIGLLAAYIPTSSALIAAGAHDHHDHSAHADQPFYAHLDVRVNADTITKAEEKSGEIEDIYTHSHLEVGGRLAKGLTINANFKLEGEPTGHNHAHGGGHDHEEEEHHDEEEHHEDEEHHDEEEHNDGRTSNRIFDDHPLLIETITINYDAENYSLFAGKFNPIVGFDYHLFPGNYGYQSIEAYAVKERIGVGGALKYDAGDSGKHRLDASTFFADTTFMSDALLEPRERTKKASGGISNTEDFSSYALSYSASDFYSLDNNFVEGLSYRFGYAKQAAGVGNEEDETRTSLSFGYKYPISRQLKANILFEHMAIDHLNGEAAHDRDYTTLALSFDYDRWTLAGAVTDINNDAEEADENHDGSIVHVSLSYLFENGIGVGLGYQSADEENEETDRIGLSFTYSYEL